MDKLPLISIIVPNYNYGNFVGEAIESVVAQTYTNWELIVVDDGSTDNSKEVIERHVKRHPEAIRAIWRPNAGQASAFNAGFAGSRGEIVCFHDNCNIWPEIMKFIKEIKNLHTLVCVGQSGSAIAFQVVH